MFLEHSIFMNRALQIAKQGVLTARPNPSVGAVLVMHRQKIIGEGFTSFYGGAHAEINAINTVKKVDKKYLKEATLYVTLEPCSHYGKTPPCVQTIIHYKIPTVVVGCLDPNPKVSGKGVRLLREAGRTVKVGVLQEKCEYHHRYFLTEQKLKRPFITLKWAESADGFIAPKTQEKNQPHWITDIYSRQQVHHLRAHHEAILIGKNTALKDNPTLNVRLTAGKSPLRLVLDPFLKLPKNLQIFKDGSPTVVFFSNEKTPPQNTATVFYEPLDFQNVPLHLLDFLYRKGIQSILVEGGAVTLQSFIENNIWDEAFVFKGEALLKEGVKAPFIKPKTSQKHRIKKDTLQIFRNF